MMRWRSTASIRVRLTAWYTAVLTAMLIVYATVTFLAVRHEFREQLEDELHSEAAHDEIGRDRRRPLPRDGGTRLGLAIAKWAVEAHGGTIAVDSSEAGSVFTLRLPREGG